MIKFVANGLDGSTLLGIGLSRENFNRMQKGQPIMFDLKELEINTFDKVLVFFGETEEAMAEMMVKGGVITRDKIHRIDSVQ